MEVCECAVVPSRQPHGKVVSHAEEPENGEVEEGDDARAIRDISDDLLLLGGKVIVDLGDSVTPYAQGSIEKKEEQDGDGLYSGRNRAPPDILRASITKGSGDGDVALDPFLG